MKLEEFLRIINKMMEDGTIGIGSEVIFDVKAVEGYQDFARLNDAYADDVCEDGGNMVLVLH